jgi:hypothetical protein
VHHRAKAGRRRKLGVVSHSHGHFRPGRGQQQVSPRRLCFQKAEVKSGYWHLHLDFCAIKPFKPLWTRYDLLKRQGWGPRRAFADQSC